MTITHLLDLLTQKKKLGLNILDTPIIYVHKQLEPL